MSRDHLLSALGVAVLITMVMASCSGGSSPASETPVSPLDSPVMTPAAVSTPSACPNGCINQSEECLIKGVVTGMGDRIYYLPGVEGYDSALPNVLGGGLWFCTEEEAIQNDFEKAPQ